MNSYPGVPPPRPSGGNGWKIAGFGCLAVFLLAAIGGVLLVRTVKSQLSHPSKNSLVGMGVITVKAAADGAQIQQAIAAYRREKGQYPRSLMDLVADGRIDGKLLHNDLDSSPSPGHVSWRYTRPAANAPGDTPILEEVYQLPVGGSSPPGRIVITLDGRSRANAPAQKQ